MRVKAAPGLILRDPYSKLIVGDEGVDVDPLDITWSRMLADGDVVPADVAAPAKKDAAK